jgi:hypothetical protein
LTICSIIRIARRSSAVLSSSDSLRPTRRRSHYGAERLDQTSPQPERLDQSHLTRKPPYAQTIRERSRKRLYEGLIPWGGVWFVRKPWCDHRCNLTRQRGARTVHLPNLTSSHVEVESISTAIAMDCCNRRATRCLTRTRHSVHHTTEHTAHATHTGKQHRELLSQTRQFL